MEMYGKKGTCKLGHSRKYDDEDDDNDKSRKDSCQKVLEVLPNTKGFLRHFLKIINKNIDFVSSERPRQ